MFAEQEEYLQGVVADLSIQLTDAIAVLEVYASAHQESKTGKRAAELAQFCRSVTGPKRLNELLNFRSPSDSDKKTPAQRVALFTKAINLIRPKKKGSPRLHMASPLPTASGDLVTTDQSQSALSLTLKEEGQLFATLTCHAKGTKKKGSSNEVAEVDWPPSELSDTVAGLAKSVLIFYFLGEMLESSRETLKNLRKMAEWQAGGATKI